MCLLHILCHLRVDQFLPQYNLLFNGNSSVVIEYINHFWIPYMCAAQTSSKPSFERGFLENRSLGYHTAEGPSSILDRLRAALSDIMETLQEGHSESVSSSVLKVEWPRHDGDIWLALNSDK